MWSSILGYVASSTNYGVTNMNNLYNFILAIMDGMEDKDRKELIDKLLIHLGKKFYKNFRKYVIEKIPNSEHLVHINRVV